MQPLSVIITGDGKPFERELKRVDAMADRFSKKQGAGIGGSGGGVAAPIGGMGGMMGRFGNKWSVASSMFTSVARDSAASLASGAPITQVLAQQMPQVLQALAILRLGLIGWAVGAAAAIGIAFAAFTWKVNDLAKSLASLQLGNFKMPIIAKIDQAAEAWQKISDRVKSAANHYNSVAESAKRLAEITQKQYAHEDKIAALRKQQALDRAFSPLARRNLEMQFAAEEVKTNKKRREEELQAMMDQADALREESQKKLAEANNPKGLGKVQADQSLAAKTEQLKFDADAAQKAKDDLIKARTGYFHYLSFGTDADAQKAAKIEAENQMIKEADAKIRQYKQFLDSRGAIEHKQSQKKELIDDSATALAAAETLDKKIADQRAENLKLGKNDEELAAMSSYIPHMGASGAPDVTDRQKINLLSVATSPLVDLNKQMNNTLKKIEINTNPDKQHGQVIF